MAFPVASGAVSLNNPENLETEHVSITVENDTPRALAPYYHNIETALEYGWRRYQFYTGGYDLDKLANAATTGGFAKPKYIYEFLNPSHMWIPGFGGGLTAWNHSQMSNQLVPNLTSQSATQDSTSLGILWHELANGWANVYVDYKGQDTNLPAWYASEGQAGFLKQHALTDSGYRTAADNEYAGAVQTYDQYISDHQAGRPTNTDIGAVTHVLLESLWQQYGWNPIRFIDRKVQTGQLSFAKDTPDEEKNGKMAFYLSQAVHQNILPFLDANYISVSDQWRQKIEALHYPSANIPIVRDLTKDQPDSPF